MLEFYINYEELKKIEEDLGFRIIMTNRHDWDTASIIKAYHGQSRIENAFYCFYCFFFLILLLLLLFLPLLILLQTIM